MNYSTKELSNLEKELKTDFNKGLPENTPARSKNVISAKKRSGFVKQLLAQMSDFMTVVLLAAAAASYFSTHMRGETDIFEPLLIVAIVLLNALLGVFQQRRAERAIEALKKLSDPKVSVLRGGKWSKIPAANLTVGDIVSVKSGDRISADMRIIEGVSLEADESSLTGESLPVQKEECTLSEELSAAEQKNMLFSATSVTAGHAKCVVCAIGMDTEMGKIAGFIMNEETEETPLQKKLSDLGKTLGIAALTICGAIFLIGILKHLEPLDMFITAVSLAVAAIPEGLPATVTVMLAIGVERMAKKNAIVKRLSAVETLGAATVICTDKTGTLTENRMTVSEVFSEDISLFTEVAYLASAGGESPTENAILNWCEPYDGWTKKDEIPFDSKRKMMSALVERKGKYRIVAKGAAEILLTKCTKRQTKNGETELDSTERRRLIKQAEAMAAKGLRTLAIAYANSSSLRESDLTFLGFIGISDPPRREAKIAVTECQRAGIQVVMITGDHIATAAAIAREVGIIKNDERVVSGKELDLMTDTELKKLLPKIGVFARVTPEQKLRIVKAFKAIGAICAMTGDGVNDAPALKASDIGCSMGKNGTDVAKEASDMVLADDNFATIVAAVKEGRRIFANIKKSVYFLLSSNIGELICVFFGVLFGFAAPLTPPQLLWINLVTDSLPAIALALDPADKDIMSRRKNSNKSLFTPSVWGAIISEGAMIGALALVAYTIGAIFYDLGGEPIIGRTMAFAVLACSQLIHAFNLRSEHSVLAEGIFKNKALVLSFLSGVILTIGLITFPKTAALFGVLPLPASAWGICASFAVFPLIIVEIAKKVEWYFTEKEHNTSDF
ncbi:MAG: calcium-translocating P-type ATPase, PMCA-type [Clostridia bacterium]|nr:calcium-translocating P-type ATPase, PMCA-type [Clostridia bacterium]